MKRFLPLVVLCLSPGLGRAQVVIHQAALDQLAGIAPSPVAMTALALPAVRRVARRVIHRRITAPSVVAFDVPPPLPGAPPPPAMAIPATARPGQPPGQAPAAPAAASAKAMPAVMRPAPRPGAVALHFAPGSAVLPASMAASLRPICAAAEPSGMVAIDAPAAGVPGDPSVAMRLSMQRAFAVRDALVACGISPSRIVPRALGAADGGDLDTTRVTLGGARP